MSNTLQNGFNSKHCWEGRDKVSSALEPSREYSTRSLYKAVTTWDVRDSRMLTMWKCNIPLKVKIFLWMAAQDRIQSSVQLKKKQWSGPEKCAVCDQLKTTYHILFQCPIAVYLWPFLRNSLGWLRAPTSCVEFFFRAVGSC